MKKITITLGAVALVIVVAVLACNSSSGTSNNKEGISELPQPVSKDSIVKRGEYLVTIMGCNDCHSPKIWTPQGPQIDSSRMLSGHPSNMAVAEGDPKTLKDWVSFNHSMTVSYGPWGNSFAANLTSDETGIGNWTEEQFFKAIREGKYKGMDNTRPLLPPMPWPTYAKASDEDLKAIFAYLKSTPPVSNVVPVPVPLEGPNKAH
jgi:hypothetical protein